MLTVVGFLWQALGEGGWCPQVGGSEHTRAICTQERVCLAGPGGLGVPRGPLCALPSSCSLLIMNGNGFESLKVINKVPAD